MFNLGDTIKKEKALTMNAITLAFVGDAVYSLYSREKLAFSTDLKASEMNKAVIGEVRASSQALFIDKLLPILTEEELMIYKRGRNSKKPTKAKSATVREYNMSTGFEAVLGYLYITGQIERLNYLLNYRG